MATADLDGFMLTISDDEDPIHSFKSGPPSVHRKKRKRGPDSGVVVNGSKMDRKKLQTQTTCSSSELEGGEDDGRLASDLEFQVEQVDLGVTDDFDVWGTKSIPQLTARDNKKPIDIDSIIARIQKRDNRADKKAKTGSHEGDEIDQKSSPYDRFARSHDDETLTDDEFNMSEQASRNSHENQGESSHEHEDDEVFWPVAHPDDLTAESSQECEDDDPVQAERRRVFFAPDDDKVLSQPSVVKGRLSFQSMSLSRPIQKGLATVGFTKPTPIQAKAIPVALLGKDVVGGAVTGSGKTGAFLIPILERLLYRSKRVPSTRVAILMPTRELAMQCFNVAKKLAAFTDITLALIVGGFSVKQQENLLKHRPDIVIATPGRFIDHMRNSPHFAVDMLEILVLDEADRMLEDGFADELNEILTAIPKSRQTMLFSATMTDSVDKLIRAGLNRPVRLLIDAKSATASGLIQEFVRVRPENEEKKLAILTYLCEKVHTDRVIVFFRQKKVAHQLRALFGFRGVKAAELHGSMTQEQRITAVEAFRSRAVSHLLATDLASRGLDIKDVSAVINYGAPQTHEIYLHRVGRTARAGSTGRACTIASESDRKVVKAVLKAARAHAVQSTTAPVHIVSRRVPSDAVDGLHAELLALEPKVDEVLRQEKEERALAKADAELRRGENLVEHRDEIMSRPRRTWFASEAQKLSARQAGRAELNGEVVARGSGNHNKRKLSNKEKKRLYSTSERKVGTGMGWKKGKGGLGGARLSKATGKMKK